MILALLIRGYDLERQSLWNDEMFTMDVASHSPSAIQEQLAVHYHHPPLYFYFAHGSTAIFGMTAWAIRLPSVIFGALSVGLIFFFTRKLFNGRAGLIAAVICLIAPFNLAYSQEGRPYALAGFLCLASFYTFYLFLNERNRYAALLYPLSTLALLYTHHWGLFTAGVQFIYVITFERGKLRGNYQILIIWTVIGMLYLPEFFALRNQFVHAASVSWFWAESPSLKEMSHLLTAFSGTYFKMASSVFSLPVIFQISGAVILAGFLITGTLLTIRGKKTGALRFSLFSFGGLIAIPFAVSFLKPEIFLWYRYTVIGFPALCAAIGGIFFTLRDTGKRSYVYSVGVAVSGMIIIGFTGTIHYMTWQKSNVKETVLFTGQMATDNQVGIIIRPKTFAPLFNYYYHGTAVQYDEAYLNTTLGDIADTAASFAYISLDIPNEIRKYMDVHFDKFAERRFPGEANMGMIVGFYRQYPDLDQWEE